MALVTRYIGKCPVCEGDYRLHKQLMVHHGYQRPGDGMIHGDCPGVGWPPYEISAEGTENYLQGVLSRIRNLGSALDRLQSGEVQEFRVLTNEYAVRRKHEAPNWKTLTPADGYEFKQVLKTRIYQTENELRYATQDGERCERLIQNWRPMPVRTLEEAQAVQDAGRAERAAEREAARQVRLDKERAKKAKQGAREQRERDFIARWREALLEEADKPVHAGTRAGAVALWKKMNREAKKEVSSSGRFLMKFVQQMGIDAQLIDLGLARMDRHYLYYADDSGWLR